MKNIVILGATGSIGTQVLDVIRQNPDKFHIIGMAASGHNVELFSKLVQEFEPERICLTDAEKLLKLKIDRYPISKKFPELLPGEEGISEMIRDPNVEMVVNAISGMEGIIHTITAIQQKKTVLIANKESLVSAGSLILELAIKHQTLIVPIDSEITGIIQCLEGRSEQNIEKIILPCTGGPFYGMSKKELAKVAKKDALKHPVWKMGEKISIDSATLMNKGFELIVANAFFKVPVSQIEIVIHPESIIHGMIQWKDGNITATMSPPDMRFAIQYALFFPEREETKFPRLDFGKMSKLTFQKPDESIYESLTLARGAAQIQGNMPAILNHANDEAVEKFLKDEISFVEIGPYIREHIAKHDFQDEPNLEELIELQRCHL
ncbi:MAG: 1-deoxy-D-xylulose-5-phosphate reductoisomerase [Candidatus Peregrinibacteria bacterium]|nr:1-deoxy-D-xylulose-5-phosphate reductoisomerase [Candidatus Peregrinibacteria bacterium]